MVADLSKLDLPKLAADAAKYPKAGVPLERMDFWRNLESSLHELHKVPDGDSGEGWLSLICELKAKKITPAEGLPPPAISKPIIDACVKDRQPIPEVCRATHWCRIIGCLYYSKSNSQSRKRQGTAKKSTPKVTDPASKSVQVCSDVSPMIIIM